MQNSSSNTLKASFTRWELAINMSNNAFLLFLTLRFFPTSKRLSRLSIISNCLILDFFTMFDTLCLMLFSFDVAFFPSRAKRIMSSQTLRPSFALFIFASIILKIFPLKLIIYIERLFCVLSWWWSVLFST